MQPLRGKTRGQPTREPVVKHLLAVLCVSLCGTLCLCGETPQPTPDEVQRDLRLFFKAIANPDGSFRPGVDPDYEGMSDSAFSDLAPAAYAVVLHKTFGWKLPDEEKTRQF